MNRNLETIERGLNSLLRSMALVYWTLFMAFVVVLPPLAFLAVLLRWISA